MKISDICKLNYIHKVKTKSHNFSSLLNSGPEMPALLLTFSSTKFLSNLNAEKRSDTSILKLNKLKRNIVI